MRVAPDEAVCRELAHTKPVTRTVSPTMTISFQGGEYDVSPLIHTADLVVGDKVEVVRNPWRPNAAQSVMKDAEGHDVYRIVKAMHRQDLDDRHGDLFTETDPV